MVADAVHLCEMLAGYISLFSLFHVLIHLGMGREL